MASETSIINVALRFLGEPRITSRTDGSTAANIVDDIYDDALDALLRSANWNFAITRLELSQSGTPPFGFDYQYPVPSNWLRTVAVYDNVNEAGAVLYRMENDVTAGPVLLANAPKLYLRYVRQVTDANEMTPLFRTALSYQLAMDMALPLAQSGTLRDRMADAATRARRKAAGVDAVEDYPDELPAGSWVTARSR